MDGAASGGGDSLGHVGALREGADAPPVVTPLTVTTTADHDDGACDANDCTLREAILAANSDGQSDDIVFASGVTGSIVLDPPLGGLTILNDTPADDLEIDGPGASVLSVSGNDAVLPFQVTSGVNATIGKLSISNPSCPLLVSYGDNKYPPDPKDAQPSRIGRMPWTIP
jgi:CSLREA domain-containing protein